MLLIPAVRLVQRLRAVVMMRVTNRQGHHPVAKRA